VLENPALYKRRKMTLDQRQKRDSEIVEKMSKAAGKLDHASIVAYEIGGIQSDIDNLENIPLIDSPVKNMSSSSSTNSTSDSNSNRRHSHYGFLSPSTKAKYWFV
jgi:hypothetical protein